MGVNCRALSGESILELTEPFMVVLLCLAGGGGTLTWIGGRDAIFLLLFHPAVVVSLTLGIVCAP